MLIIVRRQALELKERLAEMICGLLVCQSLGRPLSSKFAVAERFRNSARRTAHTEVVSKLAQAILCLAPKHSFESAAHHLVQLCS